MVNNLVARTLSAIVLIPLVIGVVYLGGAYFQAFSLICLFLMLHEWFSMNNRSKTGLYAAGITTIVAFVASKLWLNYSESITSITYPFYTICCAVMFFGVLAINRAKKTILALSAVLFLFLMGIFAFIMFYSGKPVSQCPGQVLIRILLFVLISILSGWIFLRQTKETNLFITGIIYITVPMLYWVTQVMTSSHEYFVQLIVFIFAIVWSCDIFAYLGGRLIGGPKLAPSISPKKTCSGVIVGSTFAFLICYFVLCPIFSISRDTGVLVLVFIMIVASIIGDLVESKAKRMLNVKDSGNIIPGHGGLCDRLDSFLMVTYVFIGIELLGYITFAFILLLNHGKWV